MSKSRERAAGSQRRRPLAVAALALAAIATVGATIGSTAGAGTAGPGRTTVVLGKTPTTPNPACPEMPCEGIASVTGFQVATAEEKLPYRVPFHGRVVAWTMTLAQPTNSQRSFFNDNFGRPPEAHLAILKRVPGSSPPRYRLRRQSPIRVLSAYLGRTVRFKLGKPLRVRRGNIVALSVPTWAPAFATNLSNADRWRASRREGLCGPGAIRRSRPQQVVGSRRDYGCRYQGARLLYTATVVKAR